MKVNVKFYTLSPRRFIAGTKGSYGFEKIDFSFSEEWKDLGKKVVFYPPSGEPISVTYRDEPVTVPYEVMSTKGISKYCVFGYHNEKVLISTGGEIDVINTLDDTDNQAGTPTPSDVEQVYTYLAETVAIARDLKNEAESGAFDGKDGITPHIAENGNWFFGAEDSGICAYGLKGDKGDVGATGAKGEKGEKGDSGDSSIVSLVENEKSTTITVTESGDTYSLDIISRQNLTKELQGYVTIEELNSLESALDGIIAIQNSLIGGEGQ